ncbi:hypothetical protein COU59_02375 [Candidatus Pacearchaeota archaeon CG10_big_fil_rev_8_21_14_0_10_34_12]|nr:MAG: hypothetical protein COU59_02375 [Candidatus Pacearchaeota archaeon CG10_big_fil_rev_8_21_14_0_10_34_12]
MPEKYRKAVFVVTYAKTKEGIMFLVLKRKYHWHGWEFTKGGINPRESKKSAVAREVFEETGENAKEIKKFRVFGKYKYKKGLSDREGIVGQSFSLYGVEIKFGKIKIDSKEHSSYLWLPFEEAMKKLTFRNQKHCLKIVNKWLIKEEE